jgi:hypothetical protein
MTLSDNEVVAHLVRGASTRDTEVPVDVSVVASGDADDVVAFIVEAGSSAADSPAATDGRTSPLVIVVCDDEPALARGAGAIRGDVYVRRSCLPEVAALLVPLAAAVG